MDKNLDIIAGELFNKIRTKFPSVVLMDKDNKRIKKTDKPESARFFNFDFVVNGESLGKVDVNISEKEGLVVIYSNELLDGRSNYTKKQFFNFLKELREFAKQSFMNFDTRDITKTNLDKRDYEFLSNNVGEPTMSESKLFGTSRTSYQQLGDSRLVVKHSAPVNFENPAGRAQRIDSIYIENSQGERFKYPYKHLNGARALAQHISHGGTPYDSIGKHVIGLSEELSKLRMFKNYVERNDNIIENIGGIHSKVMERIDQIKKEINNLQSSSRYEQFAESFEEMESVEIPEEIINDWIDRLTVRSFNEELKNVFPFIFKLVKESDIPVKEIDISDLIQEVGLEDNKEIDSTILPELADYESMLDKIAEVEQEEVETVAQPVSKFAETVKKVVAAGMKLEDTFEVGGNQYTLRDAIEKAGLQISEFFKDEPQQPVEELADFIRSMYNEDEGNFPKGEEGCLIACEKKFGESCRSVAEKIIERLNQHGEMKRIKELSGITSLK